MTSKPGITRIFIGREQEMAVLTAALDDASAGRGRIVMLAGEPGIGKTRIAHEFVSRAESSGAQVFWGWCYEREGAPPYWPWVQPIQSYVLGTAPDQLRAEMGRGSSEIADLIPEIHEKLPDLEPPSALEPEQTRFRLLNSVSQFLKNLAQSQSLVLVLDDLHWADTPSLLLLEFLARQIEESNILVIGTYRDIQISPQHPLAGTLAQLSRNPAFQRLALGGLEHEDVGSFIQAAGGEDASEDLINAVYAHTEGNPLFMSEVIRLLGDRENPEASAEAVVRVALRLPQGVVEAIGQRLNGLSEECIRVLTTAAVIGRQFDFNILEILSEETSELQLLELVEEALEARILQELLDQGDRYEFSHVLMQQTLLERISSGRVVRLHARIGQALETIYEDRLSGRAAELAYHFSEAAPVLGPANLIKYGLLAGLQAQESYSHETAIEHFSGALRAKGVQVPGDKPADDEQTAELLFGLGRSQAAVTARREAVSSLTRAFDFFAESANVERAVAVAEFPMTPGLGRIRVTPLVSRAVKLVKPDCVEAGRLLSRLGYCLSSEMGDYRAAQQAVDQSLAIAEATGDWALELQALGTAAQLALYELNTSEGAAISTRAIELAKGLGDFRAEAIAHQCRWAALALSGSMEPAVTHAEAGLDAAQELQDQTLMATGFWQRSMAAMYIPGDGNAARQFSDRGLAAASSDPRLLGSRALMEYRLGSETEGAVYLQRLLDVMETSGPGPTFEYANPAVVIPIVSRFTGSSDLLATAKQAGETVLASPFVTPVMEMWGNIGLGLVAVQSKDESAAELYYEALLPRQSYWLPEIGVDHVLGLLADCLGRGDDMSVHFEAARVGIPEGNIRRSWPCADYAEALLRRNGLGDSERAQYLIEEAFDVATKYSLISLVDRLSSMLKEIALDSSKTATYPGGLTEREVEVLRHLAQGKTNREIARELVLSDRTVQRHISNIYTKINARNRAEATTFALTHLPL